jgi:ATP-dependent DNA ligase
LRGFDRGGRGPEAIDPEAAKDPGIRHTDGGARRQGAALSQDLPGTVAGIVKALRAAGIEGVIAKRRNSTYQPGERSNDWVKLKLERQQEFVIGGYRPDEANGLDALLVGYYEGNRRTAEQRLRHAAFLGFRIDKAANEVRREPWQVRSQMTASPITAR